MQTSMRPSIVFRVITCLLSLLAMGAGRASRADREARQTNPPPAYPSSLTPAMIWQAYGFDEIYTAGITGKGQHIAIATYDGFNVQDIVTYFQMLNITPVPTINQINVSGTPVYDPNSATETEIDAELAGMIAPGAIIDIYSSADNTDAGETQLFTKILDDNLAKVIVYNWGAEASEAGGLEHQREMNTLLERASSSGVNVIVPCCGADSVGQETELDHSPLVVAVSGTTLELQNGHFVEEAWDQGSVSAIYPEPDWQKSVGTFSGRASPDVVLNGGAAQPVWIQNSWEPIMSETNATAEWAGFLALVSEARANQSKSTLGFLNPILYSLSIADSTNFFNRILGITGAAAGWNLQTGWGSPRAYDLLQYLSRR